MAAYTLQVAEDNEPSVCLASYSNGKVNLEADTSLIRHTLYQEKTREELSKKRRTLVTSTGHLTYVGKNYETEGILNTQPFRKYMVGVLDKETGIMKLHKADIFQMMPFIKGRTDKIAIETETPSKKPFSREDYSQSLDKVLTSFGSVRAKKAWSAAKRNKIDSSRLDASLAPAVTHAEEEVEKIRENDDTSGTPSSSGTSNSQMVTSSYIPVCNTTATEPEDVYLLTDLISPDEMSLLEVPARSLMKQTKESLKNNASFSRFIVSHFTEKCTLKRASLLIYCNSLIAMFKMTPRTIQKFGLKRCPSIPESMQSVLLNKFTEHGPSGASFMCAFTPRMKDKVLAYLIATSLRMCGYSFNSNLLQSDLQISSNKLATICRALGCTLVEDKLNSQIGQKCYDISLKIPLVFATTSKAGQKRKR